MTQTEDASFARLRPIVAIGAGLDDRDVKARRAYATAIDRAGGTPILLPPIAADPPALAARHASIAHAIVLTGGHDPIMEPFGRATDHRVTREDPARQAYDLALLDAARDRNIPTLGVCLGMQYMALLAGGTLDQHLADSTPTHADHIDDRTHQILPSPDAPAFISTGRVTSWHRQAISDPGSMRVVGRAHDGVIEAIVDPSLRFFVGVQWHPERTADPTLGDRLFAHLVAAARERLGAPAC